MDLPDSPKDMPLEFFTSGSHIFLALGLRGEGREEEAIEVFREAARRLPAGGGAHFGIGISLLSLGKPDEAIAEFEEAIRFQPEWASAYDALGRALDADGQYQKAIAAFEEGLRICPDYYAIYLHLGNACKHNGDLQAAIQAYRNAADGYGDSHLDGHICLGQALHEDGKVAEALAILTPLAEKYPNIAGIHLAFGNALETVGRIAEARKSWQRVIAIREEFVTEGLGDQKLDAMTEEATEKLSNPV